MKNKVKFKSDKLLKSFEIGKKESTLLNGGTSGYQYITSYTIPGSEGCSMSCPDAYIDHMP